MRNFFDHITSTHKCLDREAFTAVFADACKTVARQMIKVEVLQAFHEPDSKSYLFFMAGDEERAIRLLPKEALIECDFHIDLSRRRILWQRLRLVMRPLTRYLRWELETYKISARWGQRISIVDITDEQTRQSFAEIRDFIIFDQSIVLVNWYDEKGTFCGGWNVTDTNLVKRFIEITNQLNALSVPLAFFEWQHNM